MSIISIVMLQYLDTICIMFPLMESVILNKYKVCNMYVCDFNKSKFKVKIYIVFHK